MQDHAVFIKVVAPFRKRQIIGLVDPAVLATLGQQVLDGFGDFKISVLLHIFQNGKVVIIYLSAFSYHTLQAGFLHDLAVLDPVGICAGIVQTALIVQEDAGFVVEDEGGLIGTVLRSGHVQALDDVALLIEIVGVSVNGGPLALVRLLAIHIVGSAVCIGEPAVPELPLGIEGDILRQIADGVSVRIGRAGAVRFRVPAGELVVLTGKGVFGQRDICAVIE